MTLTRWTVISALGLTLATGLMIALPNLALADDGSNASATSLITEGLQNAGQDTYDTDLSVSTFIGNIIKIILSATGIVFLGITVYAGILYMTAAGETKQIKKAKDMLTSSVIGIVIIVGAYALTSYIIDAIASAATATTTSY